MKKSPNLRLRKAGHLPKVTKPEETMLGCEARSAVPEFLDPFCAVGSGLPHVRTVGASLVPSTESGSVQCWAAALGPDCTPESPEELYKHGGLGSTPEALKALVCSAAQTQGSRELLALRAPVPEACTVVVPCDRRGNPERQVRRWRPPHRASEQTSVDRLRVGRPRQLALEPRSLTCSPALSAHRSLLQSGLRPH